MASGGRWWLRESADREVAVRRVLFTVLPGAVRGAIDLFSLHKCGSARASFDFEWGGGKSRGKVKPCR